MPGVKVQFRARPEFVRELDGVEGALVRAGVPRTRTEILQIAVQLLVQKLPELLLLVEWDRANGSSKPLAGVGKRFSGGSKHGFGVHTGRNTRKK